MPLIAVENVAVDPECRFYRILDDVPLAGMPFPRGMPWEHLARAGFHDIVCLTEGHAPYIADPLHVAGSFGLQDLASGSLPRDPTRELARIRDAVGTVLSSLSAGRGVVVHCLGGTGRTGTVLGCVLRHRLGLPGDQVITYLNRLNRRRGRAGWPESDWQADVCARSRESDYERHPFRPVLTAEGKLDCSPK